MLLQYLQQAPGNETEQEVPSFAGPHAASLFTGGDADDATGSSDEDHVEYVGLDV